MSYNITAFKVKEIKDLKLPLAKIFSFTSEITIDLVSPGKIKIHIWESTITGDIKKDELSITDLQIYGEGSGTIFEEQIKPLLSKTSGRLEATLIWEGGDSITRLVVENGEIKEQELEL